ncbi:MAG: WG repeat-containing protein [Clostridia bacterium]|nr:WG repeat-containing protein [Clostridia bacterium]
MKRILAFLLMLAMLFGSVCTLASCGDGVALGDKTTTEANKSSGNVNFKDNDDNNKTPSKDNDKTTSDDNKEANKYANIKAILYAYDDGYVYQNYNGTYGLLSSDGDILYDGLSLLGQTFSEHSNYLSGYNISGSTNLSLILDKNGKIVLEEGKDNIEFISEIYQGRILAYKMTDERPSGKTYDLICYSATDMSEVFRISGQDEISNNILFDDKGYVENYYEPSNSKYADICFDIYGNMYYREHYSTKYYDSNGNEYDRISATSAYTSKQYGFPDILELNETIAWGKLTKSYSEYKNSSTAMYAVGDTKNTLGPIATLYMRSTSEWCATMDKNGKILMKPTKDIMLKYEYYNFGKVTKCHTFSNDLCCAYQPSSGLWGYVDPYGTWKIKPQYNKVTTFSYDGLAVVNDLMVIDTKGKVVLDISDTGDIYPLEGKYKRSGAYSSLYLTFSKDGTVVSSESGYGYTSNKTGSYELHGDSLIIDDFGYTAVLSEGTHTFEKSGDNIYIDGNLWVRVED